MKKILLTVGAVLVIGGGATTLVLTRDDEPKQQTENTQVTQAKSAPQIEVSYQGVEGKNALELLKQMHQVQTKNYDGLGELVTSIDGVVADSKHFWSLYVNEQQAQVGASELIAKTGETVTWKLVETQ